MARGCTTAGCGPGRNRARSWYDVRNDALDSRGDRALVTTRGNRGVLRRSGVLGVAARHSASTAAGAILDFQGGVRRGRRSAAADALSGREVSRLGAARSRFAAVAGRDLVAGGRALLASSGCRSTGAGAGGVADLLSAGRAPGAGEGAGVALRAARAGLYVRWQVTHPPVEGEADLMKLAIRIGSPGELPFRAPHLVDAVLADAGGVSEVHTTLDRRLQALLERHIRGYVAAQARLGVHNAAAMLVDSRTMAVQALVGSADFFNKDIAGQVNGTAAKRSPGSTLKPYIYALALDQGVLHPMTVLKDAPSAFGAYSPEKIGRASCRD